MLNEIIMILGVLILASVMGYLAWDSYKEFKEHEPK
ncbi:hypothetical protein BPLS_P6423 [Bathymodiolus platifrons methanotrophic gill symbiont]|nr:hypothetical protein BPLS_P6423 [Bathymodiolus platifrons methanotrophic gill symbiont]